MDSEANLAAGLSEEASQFERQVSVPLLAHPAGADFDWEAAMDKIEERFSQTLARLAE